MLIPSSVEQRGQRCSRPELPAGKKVRCGAIRVEAHAQQVVGLRQQRAQSRHCGRHRGHRSLYPQEQRVGCNTRHRLIAGKGTKGSGELIRTADSGEFGQQDVRIGRTGYAVSDALDQGVGILERRPALATLLVFSPLDPGAERKVPTDPVLRRYHHRHQSLFEGGLRSYGHNEAVHHLRNFDLTQFARTHRGQRFLKQRVQSVPRTAQPAPTDEITDGRDLAEESVRDQGNLQFLTRADMRTTRFLATERD